MPEMACFEVSTEDPKRVIIVDDVVTKGRMFLATATLLAERFPSAELRAFALIRTMGLEPDVEKIVAPCVGVIKRGYWNDADRQDDVAEACQVEAVLHGSWALYRVTIDPLVHEPARLVTPRTRRHGLALHDGFTYHAAILRTWCH